MHILHFVAIFGITTKTLNDLLSTWGYPIVGIFVGIESTGIPFPGETMLVTAAIYAGTGHLQIEWVIVSAAAGAILGDNLGFAIGHFGGYPLIRRYGKYVRLKPEHLKRAEEFFAKHGDKTVFFGRFVAVLRAWAAFLAGVNRMRWHKFLLFNAAGGIVWSTLYGLLGYFLGNNLPLLHRVEKILGVGGVVAAVVVAVVAFIVWKRRQSQRPAKAQKRQADPVAVTPSAGSPATAASQSGVEDVDHQPGTIPEPVPRGAARVAASTDAAVQEPPAADGPSAD